MNVNLGLGLKLPVQFLLVFIISAIITIYLGASVSEIRIDSRNTSINFNNTIGSLNNSYTQFPVSTGDVFWENGFLWACPLH